MSHYCSRARKEAISPAGRRRDGRSWLRPRTISEPNSRAWRRQLHRWMSATKWPHRPVVQRESAMSAPFRSNARRIERASAAPTASALEVEIEGLGVSPPGRYLLQISDEFVHAIADRVVELQREAEAGSGPRQPELLTVTELAARLRVSAKWVYAHQNELGAVRLGEGPKARLRFPMTAARVEPYGYQQAAPAPDQSVEEAKPAARRRRRLASRPVPAIEPSRRTA